MNFSDFQERDLIIALKSGDVEAFNTLYFAYHRKLFAFILKILGNPCDVEDLVQKVFIKIWEKRQNIAPEKSFNNYIFRITRNEVYDILKKRIITEYYDDCIIGPYEEVDGELESKRIVEIIYQLVEKLPERRKQIFLLSREEGLTYKQIAFKLGISENTVDTQIRNSLNFIREQLPKRIQKSDLSLHYFQK